MGLGQTTRGGTRRGDISFQGVSLRRGGVKWATGSRDRSLNTVPPHHHRGSSPVLPSVPKQTHAAPHWCMQHTAVCVCVCVCEWLRVCVCIGFCMRVHLCMSSCICFYIVDVKTFVSPEVAFLPRFLVLNKKNNKNKNNLKHWYVYLWHIIKHTIEDERKMVPLSASIFRSSHCFPKTQARWKCVIIACLGSVFDQTYLCLSLSLCKEVSL